MYKFILVTFGFLTWGFYEMSGGADFEPASARLAAQQTIVAEALVELEIEGLVSAENGLYQRL